MPTREPDSGVTLAEVVVSMAVMSIVSAVFTASFLHLYRALNRTDAAVVAQQQLAVAYRRLDREVRYASAISLPAVIGGDAYVEYVILRLANPEATPPSTTTRSWCVQLRLSGSGRRLLRRSWDPAAQPLAPTAWTPLADAVRPGGAAASPAQPFTLQPADATYNHQRLRVSLASTAGQGETAQSREGIVTFSALNSDPATVTDTVCTAGRSLP